VRKGLGNKLKTAEYENKKNIRLKKNFKELTFPFFTFVRDKLLNEPIKK